MKISKVKNIYFDITKPLIKQLWNYKKSCFQPHKSDLQLIKFECDECSRYKRYSKCEFYEATHTKEFETQLKEIKTKYIIDKPPYIPKNATRPCYK